MRDLHSANGAANLPSLVDYVREPLRHRSHPARSAARSVPRSSDPLRRVRLRSPRRAPPGWQHGGGRAPATL